jgi:biopolymer transport protein TolR
MGISLGSAGRGTLAEINVVPLIDVLLVLLIIFMVISPHVPLGLPVSLPQPASSPSWPNRLPAVIVVQLLADGSLRINQDPVVWQDLQGRLEEVFKMRASRVAFIRADRGLEFGTVTRAVDVMRASGIVSVGLLTPELENAR